MAKNALNLFLTDTFHTILKAEEIALSRQCPDLSIKEIHVIEAVCHMEETGDNRASSIAQQLAVTAGTLTVSLNTLEKKGYIQREKDKNDKRIVRVTPTGKGITVNEIHRVFHDEMVQSVLSVLPANEVPVLVQALDSISTFFRGKYMISREEKP